MDNHSIDVDHDPKEPIVAGNNLFQEEYQQFSSKNFDVQQEETNVAGNNFFQEEDQQFSAKKLDAQLEMEERFAVDTLCSLVDFDFPTEQMHYQLPTEPMMPEATAIHDQLDTLSMKNVDSVQGYNDAKVDVNPTVAVNSLRVPLERDHKDLFRPSNSPKTRVNVPKEIINFLREIEEHHFYFPWLMDGTFVYNNFWQGLLGIGKERRGWLSDTLPCCYANGVTYDVPWFAQSVEKTEVLDRKNIDPANYFITYRLVNNLSLDVSNLTQLGLAYRERLTDFF
ncbi:hypothetical protein Tco_1128032 [Tanacetum coccineum]